MRVPTGGRLLPGCGASGVGRSPTPDCPPSGRAAGAHYPLNVDAGLLRAWGPVTNPTARAPASCLCALWGRHKGARVGRLLPGCGASGVGRSPTPECPPSGRAAGAHYPLAVGAGGCACGNPSPTPQRALLRAVFALWGRHEGARRGRPWPGCGASGVRRSPTPDSPPSGEAAGAHYPLAAGAGGCGRGYPSPTPQRALWGRHEGARGGRLLPGCGVSGVGRSPSPDCPPSGEARGPLPTGCGCGGVRAWGPVTNPTARALACCGGGMRLPGGGAPLAWVWGLRARALSRPRLPAPWAGCRGPLPTGSGCGGCGRGDPSPTPQRALLRAGFARCGGGMRVPGGQRLLPGCGASGVGRSPTPDCPPSRRAAGAHYPLAVGAGECGRGDP